MMMAVVDRIFPTTPEHVRKLAMVDHSGIKLASTTDSS
jgi:hypothetical protein